MTIQNPEDEKPNVEPDVGSINHNKGQDPLGDEDVKYDVE
jgi:hypothetical protein